MIGMLRGHVESVDAASAIIEVGEVGDQVRTTAHLAHMASMHAGRGNQGLHFVECVPGRHHFIRLRHAGLETHVPAIAEGQVASDPKVALSLLSTLPPDRLARAVADGDATALAKAPGIRQERRAETHPRTAKVPLI